MTILWASLMISILTYRTILTKVRFPVYAVLGLDDSWIEDGLVFHNGLVLDDRNQPFDTIGLRRLHTPHKKKQITKVYFDFIELLDAKPTQFIDTNGVLFEYEKTVFCDVQSYKINKKFAKDTHTILFCKGINNPYVLKRYPHAEEWAQILCYGSLPWKLYSLSQDKIDTFKRKI
jgi:hypothetical protein